MNKYNIDFASKNDRNVSLVPSEKKNSQRADECHKFICSILNEVSKSNIETWVEFVSSFHTRHTKSRFINDVAQWLKTTLHSFGYANVYFHEYNKNGNELKNVICHKVGLSRKIILICAHYDCRMEDLNNFTDRAPGANDNASGVCSVLELAKVLSQVTLDYSIQFVFFSGEEQGQWGSQSYAEYASENNLNVYRLINLDMIGQPDSYKRVILERDLGNIVSTNDNDSQRFGEILEQAAVDYTDIQVLLGPIYDSDYMPFEAAGYVVVGLYDGGQVHKTYHSKDDLPKELNFDYLVSVTKLILASILNMQCEL